MSTPAYRNIVKEERASTGATVRIVRLKLTPAQVERIEAAKADGVSLKDIATRFGCSTWTLRDRLAEVEK